MSKSLEIVRYSSDYADKWDKFIGQSINGTFLQSRKFLSYHPKNRFEDNSLMFMTGGNIVAVLPANVVRREKKTLVSHQGSTFGGIVTAQQFMRISYMDSIFTELEIYLKDQSFDEIILKVPGRIYQKSDTDLIDYFCFLNGYDVAQEVGYYIQYAKYKDDIVSNFTASRRRDYRYSLKHGFTFRKLDTKREITEFYNVLCNNYLKFKKNPVHTLNELLDFKYVRLPENTDFYGVFSDNTLIAGGMIFKFEKQVFHTQYLAVMQDRKDTFANEFLYKSLIEEAKKEGYQYLSFGTSTFDGGKVLNRPLAQYKEGFGTSEYVNRTYIKNLT